MTFQRDQFGDPPTNRGLVTQMTSPHPGRDHLLRQTKACGAQVVPPDPFDLVDGPLSLPQQRHHRLWRHRRLYQPGRYPVRAGHAGQQSRETELGRRGVHPRPGHPHRLAHPSSAHRAPRQRHVVERLCIR